MGTRARPVGRSRLARQVFGLKNRIAGEVMFQDENVSATASNAVNNYVQEWTSIAEGTDFSQRSGRQIKYNSLSVNWTCTMNAKSTETIVRLVTFCDKKPIPEAPANFGDVYGAAGDFRSYINKALGAGDRFVILRDKTVLLNTVIPQRHGKFMIGLKGVVGEYNDTDDDAIIKNEIITVAISDQSVDLPTVSLLGRFRFYDN